MRELPKVVKDYVGGSATERWAPAFLSLDGRGRVLKAGGDLGRYGLGDTYIGDAVVGRLACLFGALPHASPTALVLPRVELENGRFADVHIFTSDESCGDQDRRGQDWVVLLDATDATQAQQRLQQSSNEARLLRSRLRKVEARALHPVTSERRALLALETVVLESVDGDELIACGALPAWFRRLAGMERECVRFDAKFWMRFPFVENFLADARQLWQQATGGRLESGPWVEVSENGEEVLLHASAVRRDGARFLLIERRERDAAMQQRIVQAARSQRLTTQKVLDREQEANRSLRQERRSLERSVIEHTEDLERMNAELTREIVERERAVELLIEHQERLRSLALELSRTEECERRRIAQGLHDQVGQTLALSKMKLASMRQTNDDAGLIQELSVVYDLLSEVVEFTRSLTFELGSPLLYDLGLEPALDGLAEQIAAQFDLQVSYRDDSAPKPLSEELKVVLFQIVRELLFNITKHANARSVQIASQRRDTDVEIRVVDDGDGFDVGAVLADPSRERGFGLFSIRERLKYLGGEVTIESEPGRGTTVSLIAPLDGEGDGASPPQP